VVTLRVIKIDVERRRIGLSLRKVDSPAYADLDWKMALSEEIDKMKTSTSSGATSSEETEVEAEAETEVETETEAKATEE
jgi:small subunit ribosomal protein S1